uniref:Thyroglobulin type-1 domain-containing protein n=1 Tax=Caenorhabditis tropicalis TaxID=1561998 RepID=A0A1I7U292_9PELO
MRRRALLDELRTLEIVGQAIPLCEDSGQCLAGTDVCWCVTRYGRRLTGKESKDEKGCETVRRKQENLALKAAALLKEQRMREETCKSTSPGECPLPLNTSITTLTRCLCDSECEPGAKCCPGSITNPNYHACLPALTKLMSEPISNEITPTISMVCGANEQYSACFSSCQPSCQDPSTPACPAPGCQPGCICLPGYIRRDSSPRSACVPRALCQAYDLTIRCADERRQYQTCGSACPISCASRNQPRCTERCVTGCFCKIPFILENADDPLHSRCILPSECPEIPTPAPDIVEQFVQRNPQMVGTFGNTNIQYPTTPRTTPTPKTTVTPKLPTLIPEQHCEHPLKNYQSCGSKCPASCDRPLSQAASLDCALSCEPGCFCRLPYVLADSRDPNSTCILPQLCPRKKNIPPSTASLPATCSDPRKEWSQCGALHCSRSCANPLGRCGSGQCFAGCVCRQPYVLLHPNDPTSRCVLPAECDRGCEDPTKEFMTCGSSCPMGCDNRHPKNCAPCQTGCFCKNGLVFESSATWHTSKCVKIEECPEEEETTTEATTTEATTLPPATTVIAEVSLDKTTVSSSSQCPSTTFDVGGRGCNTDMDCPVEQRCCRPVIVSLGVNPQRCVCPDKHAVWSSCGTLCPEYCGQPSVPVCSGTCSAGCHCAPGFVRARNDVTAPCVPRESCSSSMGSSTTNRISPVAASMDEHPVRFATIREITDPFVDDVIAVAILHTREGSHIGRFTFSQLTSTALRIHGEVYTLPGGRHAVVLHQFGDSSEGCSRVGAPFSRSLSPSLGDITETGKFDRIVDWPVADVVGRALVIYSFSTSEWSQRTHFGEKPLACGTIGIAKVA